MWDDDWDDCGGGEKERIDWGQHLDKINVTEVGSCFTI